MKITWLNTLSLAWTLLACNPPSEPGADAQALGSVGFKFSLPDDTVIQTLDYTITGPNSYAKAGTLRLDGKAQIEGIPVDRNYSFQVKSAQCAGSASFDISADSVTAVTVRIACSGVTPDNRACPIVETASATPSADGQSIALKGFARMQGEELAPTYKWTVSAGTLIGASANDVTLICPPGGGEIAMTFEVGAADTTCSDKQTLPNVSCKPGA